MRTIAFLLLMFLQTSRPTPTPQPGLFNTTTTTANLWKYPPPSAITFTAPNGQARVVIHNSGNVILEIYSVDGKQNLAVMATGEVKGNLPHDKAADEFWRSMAKAFPGFWPPARPTENGEQEK